MRRLLLVAATLVPLIPAAQVPEPPAASPSPAPPPVSAGRISLLASAGAAWAASDDLKAFGFDAGMAFELGVTVRVVPHVALGASAGYLGLADATSGVRRTANDSAAPTEQIAADRKATAIPILATVRVSAGWRGLEAFGRAGAGVAFASFDARWRSSVTGSSSYSGSDAALAVQLGGGVSAPVSARISLGVEASYLRATARLFDGPAQGDTARVPGGATRIDSVVLAAGLVYRP